MQLEYAILIRRIPPGNVLSTHACVAEAQHTPLPILSRLLLHSLTVHKLGFRANHAAKSQWGKSSRILEVTRLSSVRRFCPPFATSRKR